MNEQKEIENLRNELRRHEAMDKQHMEAERKRMTHVSCKDPRYEDQHKNKS